MSVYDCSSRQIIPASLFIDERSLQFMGPLVPLKSPLLPLPYRQWPVSLWRRNNTQLQSVTTQRHYSRDITSGYTEL